MSISLKQLEIEALRLPAEERAFLADRLLNSLGGDVLSDVDAAWIKEAERRYHEYKTDTCPYKKGQSDIFLEIFDVFTVVM